MVIVACGRIGPSMPWAAQPRGVVAGDLLGHRALGAADPPGRGEPRIFEHMDAHHIVLPLGEVQRIGREGKDLRRGARSRSWKPAVPSVLLLPLPAFTRQCYDGVWGGKVTGGRVRGAPKPPARGGLPHARLAQRSRRRGPRAWLRLARADPNGIQNTRGWLTTVVARVCLDMLRSRKARHEVPLDTPQPADSPDPEQEAMLADSIGLACWSCWTR